jgi:hypothetical protein
MDVLLHDTTELAIIVSLVGLGVIAAVQEIRLRRWDPDFFRRGLRAVKQTATISAPLTELSAPPGIRSHMLGPYEIAFVAPVLNGSLMRGLLRYRPELASVEVVGHLQWGVCSLFLALAVFGLWSWASSIGVILLFAGAYLGERRNFVAALRATARHVA